jgi:hypothetical protein
VAPVRRTFSDRIRRVAMVLAVMGVIQFALGVGRVSVAEPGFGLSFSCSHANGPAGDPAPAAPRHDPAHCCLAHCAAFSVALFPTVACATSPLAALTEAPAPASGFVTPPPKKLNPTNSPRAPPHAT